MNNPSFGTIPQNEIKMQAANLTLKQASNANV